MIFEYMILILIACLISHTLNDLLFIIYYKFVITFPMSFCLTHSTQKLRASFSDFLWLAHCEKCPNTEYFPGPYFPVFGLNTEIYGVNLRIQSKYRKIRTRNNSVFGLFSRSVWRMITLYGFLFLRCLSSRISKYVLHLLVQKEDSLISLILYD